ncbi:MAG: ComF family protein [Xanthobacteraceae bacterium]|nr:ComF family protein [Xanthobacteraceae bacterium]
MSSDAAPSSALSRLSGAWRSCRAAAATVSRAALDVALPTLCAACREPVAGDGLCASCWGRLSFIEPPFCPRLGIPFAYDPGPGVLSMQASTTPPAFDRARAAVRYDDVAKMLVHALKYQDRTDLAPTLGRWMTRAGDELLADADLLVPVPLHWRRAWSRRYNQSGALAAIIARHRRVPVAGDVLRRVRPTQHQIGLSRAERAANVQGAFAVAPDRAADLAGRRVVLIDDVLTSGATADACARALRRGRARRVDVLVFARVVEPTQSPI